MATSYPQVFVAGVPAAGKTWLGSWLAAHHGYVHIDAERNDGEDFDTAGVHAEWDEVVETGRAERLTAKLSALNRPVILNWGFPPRFLYVVAALQHAGVEAWWIQADRARAREAFIRRGGIAVPYFERQMDLIEQHWLLIRQVFGEHVVDGLNAAGGQREPEELAREMGLVV